LTIVTNRGAKENHSDGKIPHEHPEVDAACELQKRTARIAEIIETTRSKRHEFSTSDVFIGSG